MSLPLIEFKHILYTTDFSENTQDVCAYAASISKQYNAKLTLLHVVQDELLDLMIFDVGIEREKGVQNRFTIQKEHFQNMKDQVVKIIEEEYCWDEINREDILVEKGNPVKTILRVAEEKKCDLIVMGIKGRSTLEDATMGDTVRRVLHRSSIPVLVIDNSKKVKK